MPRPAAARSSLSRPRALSGPAAPVALPLPRTGRHRTALPRMSELAIDRSAGGRIVDLRHDPQIPHSLPRGRAGGRYRCCACGAPLILTGPASAGSRFTPRFRHDASRPGSDHCSAPAQLQADVQADLTRVLDLRDELSALPQVSAWLRIDSALAGQYWQLPPAVIVQRGSQTAVIERPRRLLSPSLADQRLKAVRARHGAGTQHWWIFDREDPVHYSSAGSLSVRPHGQSATHHKVQPTPAQRHINASGGTVCWLAGHTLLIPYGGHTHQHAARDGEDWSGDMASWRQDWRISHPRPANEAHWWGLVPIALSSLGRPAGLRLTPAFQVMTRLAQAEQGRERHRRHLARNHAQHHATHHRPPQQLHLPTPTDETHTEPETQQAAASTAATREAPAVAPPRFLPPRPDAAPERPAETRGRFSWRRFFHYRGHHSTKSNLDTTSLASAGAEPKSGRTPN
ncbi:hypothetical protein [Streptomyces sp. NPDC051677]|uniref:hypothetical protein n=1 Tax=Streptomyces sp. NPDC051677 TaxID=3365669 RepID=UPI0037D0949D